MAETERQHLDTPSVKRRLCRTCRRWWVRPGHYCPGCKVRRRLYLVPDLPTPRPLLESAVPRAVAQAVTLCEIPTQHPMATLNCFCGHLVRIYDTPCTCPRCDRIWLQRLG